MGGFQFRQYPLNPLWPKRQNQLKMVSKQKQHIWQDNFLLNVLFLCFRGVNLGYDQASAQRFQGSGLSSSNTLQVKNPAFNGKGLAHFHTQIFAVNCSDIWKCWHNSLYGFFILHMFPFSYLYSAVDRIKAERGWNHAADPYCRNRAERKTLQIFITPSTRGNFILNDCSAYRSIICSDMLHFYFGISNRIAFGMDLKLCIFLMQHWFY